MTTQTLPTPQDFAYLSPAELSRMAEIIQRQIEYHLAEIERLEGIVERLKRTKRNKDSE